MDENNYTIDDVKNLAELVVPKLEAVRDGGSASTIHEANRLICMIQSWISLTERPAPTRSAESALVTAREYIRTAELWLTELVKDK